MSQFKDTYNKYKSEVVVSVITAFICFLGKSIFNYLKDTGSRFIDVFGNYIYYKMGRIDSLSLIEYILGLFLGTIACCFIFLYISLLFKSFRKKIEVKKKIITKNDILYKNQHLKLFISIVAFLDILLLISFPLGIIYCLDSKHNFDLKMTALKPYITVEKYDLLYSEWVTIYGKKDLYNI